jgi:hypothetical protein
MAARKKVYVASTKDTLTEKKRDVATLKSALVRVFREYRKLKAQQQRFEAALGDLCSISTRWSIPRKECIGQ